MSLLLLTLAMATILLTITTTVAAVAAVPASPAFSVVVAGATVSVVFACNETVQFFMK